MTFCAFRTVVGYPRRCARSADISMLVEHSFTVCHPFFVPLQIPLADRLKGLPYGARVLLNLVAQLHAFAGPAAVDTFLLILHVDDVQLPLIVKDLVAHKFYGCVQLLFRIFTEDAYMPVCFFVGGPMWVKKVGGLGL